MGEYFFFFLSRYMLARSQLTRALRGALTNRPYEVPACGYSNFAPNPCYTVDTSVVTGDNFDFWAYREEQTNKRQQEFEKERKQIVEKFSEIAPDSGRVGFIRVLEEALAEPTFRETVTAMSGNNFDNFHPLHFQAVAERESLRGEPLNVRTIQLMMLTGNVTTNQQDYVLLFRSYWKNGTSAHLVSLLQEMDLFGIAPTAEMFDVTGKACSAGKDTEGSKVVQQLKEKYSKSKNTQNDVSYADKVVNDAEERLRRIDLTREILEKEMPPGDFFYAMFDTHKQLS